MRKKSIIQFPQFLSPKGFTLIELILYMGILSILITVLSTLFAAILDVQLESESRSSVDQDGRYILAKLSYDFQSNYPVTIEEPSSPGDSSPTLRININDDITATTYTVDENGDLILTNNLGAYSLNSSGTTISNFIVERIGLNDSNDTVRISFTISSRIHEPDGYQTRNMQTTFASN